MREHVDGVRHVVQGLEDEDEVVPAGELGIGRVALVERDAILHAAALQVATGLLDGERVEIDTVHVHERVGASDRDAGPAAAAGDVRDARGRLGEQPFVDSGHRGQPPAPQQVREHRSREGLLPLDEVRAVLLERNTGTGPVRLEQLLHRLAGADDEPSERPHEVEAQLVEQGLVVAGGEAETAFHRVRLGVVNLEDAGRGLLLEPLPRIALVHAGGVREATRRERPRVGQRPVEAQPVAEIDAVEIHRAQGRLEEATHERVTSFFGGGYEQFSVTHVEMFVDAVCAAVESSCASLARACGSGVSPAPRLAPWSASAIDPMYSARIWKSALISSGAAAASSSNVALISSTSVVPVIASVRLLPICWNSSQFSADAKSSPLVSVVSVVSVSVLSVVSVSVVSVVSVVVVGRSSRSLWCLHLRCCHRLRNPRTQIRASRSLL